MTQEIPVRLVVGLGNPGREYENTRHNAGFMVVSRLLSRLPGPFEESHRYESRCFRGRFHGRNLLLQMPLTFMNLSGNAVAPLVRKENLEPSSVLVVSDDMDLPLGTMRIRRGGSAGGHHGLESIMAGLGSPDFLKLRIGIGRSAPGQVVDYVLSRFDGEEGVLFEETLNRAAEAVCAVLTTGPSRAMNQFNGKNIRTAQEQ